MSGSGELQQAAYLMGCLADLAWCSVCGCMQVGAKPRALQPLQGCTTNRSVLTRSCTLCIARLLQTQHKIELDERDSKGPPPPQGPMVRGCCTL